MGNCFLNKLGSEKHKRIVTIVQTDRKVEDLTTPILVKDLSTKFTCSGVSFSKKSVKHLPLDSHLKLGRTYFLLSTPAPATAAQSFKSPSTSPMGGREGGGAKRIKVVITKQQLHVLLTKQLSVQDVHSWYQRQRKALSSARTHWKPKLEPIPEENQL